MNKSGKGVFTKIAEDDEMPVDENGNRADIVMDGLSTISRMNLGRLYETYINAAFRDCLNKIKHNLNISPELETDKKKLKTFFNQLPANVKKEAFDFLVNLYKLVSIIQYESFMQGTAEEQIQHLYSCLLDDRIYVYYPPDNQLEGRDIIRNIENSVYRPIYGPVTYRDYYGNKVTTKKPVRVSKIYFMLLEKTGNDWSAVSSGKLQTFGVLSHITKFDKFAEPTRLQATRNVGEDEARIFSANCSPDAVAELIDRYNNPLTHKEMVNSILNAPQPSNVDVSIDRSKIEFGGAKPLQLVKHLFMCAGYRFAYANKEKEND